MPSLVGPKTWGKEATKCNSSCGGLTNDAWMGALGLDLETARHLRRVFFSCPFSSYSRHVQTDATDRSPAWALLAVLFPPKFLTLI